MTKKYRNKETGEARPEIFFSVRWWKITGYNKALSNNLFRKKFEEIEDNKAGGLSE